MYLATRAFQMFVVLVVAVSFAVAWDPLADTSEAETYDQMVARVISTLRNQSSFHQQVWDGCGDACIQATMKDNGWWITPLTAKLNSNFPSWATPVTEADVAHYAVVRSWEWGLRFEATKAANTDCRAKSTSTKNLCAPTMDDWVNAYADLVEQTRADFNSSPQVFAVNRWSDDRYWRKTKYYGGPY